MSRHVGCRTIGAFDPIQHAHISAWLLYPTAGASRAVRFGAYSIDVAMDAAMDPAIAGGPSHVPLVAFSHGNGSTPWVHRGLATHLVHAGFAVLMIEHPGNNRSDNSLGFVGGEGRVKAVLLEHRPRHVRLAVDAALADTVVGPWLQPSAYAVVGESMGGYTALALAGGHAMAIADDIPDARLTEAPSELLKLAFPVPLQPDKRARAAVLLSPALGFFMADGALADVRIPLLVRTGDCDALCPTAQVAFCLRSLPELPRLQRAEVVGAGHFSFQTPYPAELAHLPSAQDPPGFDRAAYQMTLKRDVTAFLRQSFG